MAKANEGLYGALLNAYSGAFPQGSTLTLRAGKEAVVTIKLPSGAWKASGRRLDSVGAWSGTASAVGIVDNYVLASPDGSYVDEGSVTGVGGGGDMQMDNPSLVRNQVVTVTGFSKEF